MIDEDEEECIRAELLQNVEADTTRVTGLGPKEAVTVLRESMGLAPPPGLAAVAPVEVLRGRSD